MSDHANHKTPCEGCEVCELATELAEERTLHQATLRDLAEERARTTRLTEALEDVVGHLNEGDRSVSYHFAEVRVIALEALAIESGAGTEQPA